MSYNYHVYIFSICMYFAHHFTSPVCSHISPQWGGTPLLPTPSKRCWGERKLTPTQRGNRAGERETKSSPATSLYITATVVVTGDKERQHCPLGVENVIISRKAEWG